MLLVALLVTAPFPKPRVSCVLQQNVNPNLLSCKKLYSIFPKPEYEVIELRMTLFTECKFVG